MVPISRGDFIWLFPTSHYGPKMEVVPSAELAIGARVLAIVGNQKMPEEEHILLVDEEGKKIQLDGTVLMRSWIIRPMHQTSIQGVEDLLQLSELHEMSILRNLHIRYREQLYCTRIGHRILLALCPPLSDNQFVPENHDISPNIASVGSGILQRMIQQNDGHQHSASVVLSGEPGSGTSQCTKQLIHFLSGANESLNSSAMLTSRINAIGLIMDAFGKARTTSDENGTRMAQYWEMRFATSAGHNKISISSVHLEHFLLEKGRVVEVPSWPENQGNFHIFYSLLAGLNAHQKLELDLISCDPKDYHFLEKTRNSFSPSFKVSTNKLADICGALRTLMFKESEIEAIRRILAAILHLGNMQFNVISANGEDRFQLRDRTNVARVCKLLKVDESRLISALTTTAIGNIPLDLQSALDARDCLARECYVRLVDGICAKAAQALHQTRQTNPMDHPVGSIRLLEVPGIESNCDVVNNFEQLCINYMAECVQQFFVRRIFKLEQAEYEAQGLPVWNSGIFSDICYTDNAPLLDTLAIHPLSLMSVLDNASCAQNVSDEQAIEQLHHIHIAAQSDVTDHFFLRPKSRLCTQFVVRHYSGPVEYRVKGILAKNRDHFPAHLHQLLLDSKCGFVRRIMTTEKHDDICSAEVDAAEHLMGRNTMANRCRRTMDALMHRLEQCSDVYFVRCIRPNDTGANHFDRSVVLRQLRHMDVLATVEQCRAGFAVNMDYAQFVDRYGVLIPRHSPIHKSHQNRLVQVAQEICQEILAATSTTNNVNLLSPFEFGSTKIFLRAHGHSELELQRSARMRHCAVIVQKTLRCWTQRRHFERLCWAATVFQKNWRRFAQRQAFLKFVRAITRLQALVRAHQCVVRYRWLHAGIVRLQAHCRATLLRHQFFGLPSEYRHHAMAQRLKAIDLETGEPPALDQHEFELDLIQDSNKPNSYNGITFRFVEQQKDRRKENAFGNERSDLLGRFRWEKFALAHFQNVLTIYHSRQPLRHSLMRQKCTLDELCAMSIWRRLQEVMGDAVCRTFDESPSAQNVPIMVRLRTLFDVSHSNALLQQLRFAIITDNSIDLPTNIKHNILVHCGTSALEKMQFVAGIGILRAPLRDEIYSQLCKQIVKNPSDRSKRRAIGLMALFATCFAPSDHLLPFLNNFVRRFTDNHVLAGRIEASLARTRRFGHRREPPIKAELFASMSNDNAQMFVPVHLANGTVVPMFMDSHSTAEQMCTRLGQQIGLDDPFGFGIYVLSGKQHVQALGAGSEVVLDTIALCEHRGERNWRVVLRKDLFWPHKSDHFSPLATELIYRQVVSGIHSGEYLLEKQEDVVALAALQHFVDISGKPKVDMQILDESLDRILPNGTLEGDDAERQRWIQFIMHAFRKKFVHDGSQPDVERIKLEAINFARNEWPLNFSRIFILHKYSGPALASNQIAMALNSDGIVLLDHHHRQNQLRTFGFAQLASVTHTHSKKRGAESISLHLLNGDRYVFQSRRAQELATLLSCLLQELRLRSIYAVALQNSTDQNFDYSRGDLLLLDRPFGELAPNTKWIQVENARNGMHGKIHRNFVHVLSTADKPTVDEMATLLAPSEREPEDTVVGTESEYDGLMTVTHHSVVSVANVHYGCSAIVPYPYMFTPLLPSTDFYTLQKFAAANFRQIAEADSEPYPFSTVHNDLWRHSCKPLKAPLLKRLNTGGKEEVVKESLISYGHILAYMGDQLSPSPYGQQHFAKQATDMIFRAPLKYETLRDETYCQLMKQLTDNPNPISEERGWELIWLCLGLFPPSKGLRAELDQFLRSRPFPMAADCVMRLENGSKNPNSLPCRRCPPHFVELEAVRHRQTQIYHKIHFPNGSHEAIEMESWSRAKDLCERISTRLCLQSAFGFCLFVKVGEKVVSVPMDEHFFDFLQQLQDWAQNNSSSWKQSQPFGPSAFAYQVHFMRKLWLDVVPGADPRQDLIFHYHQELPKFLRGYHGIGKKDAPKFAALILRAQTKDHKQPPVAHIQHILHQLVPKDLLKAHNVNEWEKLISAELIRPEMPSCSSEAKLEFVRQLANEPTFGSAFFEVKQSADPKMGQKLLIAINRHGLMLFNAESKHHICTYGFEQISQWQPANTYFHITLDKGNRLLLETTLGHKMDDLLMAYMQTLIARQGKHGGSPSTKLRNKFIDHQPCILLMGHRQSA